MDRHSARFIDAEELAALTGVSKAGAYKIIQQLNEELKQSANLQSCGCRLAIFVNEQNNKI